MTIHKSKTRCAPWAWGLIAGAVFAGGFAGPAQAADVKDPRVRATVDKAAVYLRGVLNGDMAASQYAPNGARSLIAYALIKVGDSPNSPEIQKVLDDVVKRTAGGNFSAGKDGHYAVYTAGTELMLLEAADPAKYRQAMEVLVKFLIDQQHATGAWDYTDGFRGGDTSQCQYALMGCWAAQRAGIEIPLALWDKIARWCIQTQGRDGGFSYSPRGMHAAHQVPGLSTTMAALTCLYISKLHLYPDDADPRKEKESLRFGVLEKVELDQVESIKKANQSYKAETSLNDIRAAIDRGMGWVARSYRIRDSGLWHYNYLYAMERTAALADTNQIAGHDWYREGAEFLAQSQSPQGTWADNSEPIPSTAFGILFLMRATGTILGRVPDPLNSGLLAGGRGLPSDLSQAIVSGGKVQETKDLGPIDQLLAEIEKVESVNLEAQQAIIEKVVLGDREELIKQKPRLVKLAKHPDAEIRRTALWAISRTEDLSLAHLLYEAFDDENVDVMVEAQNGLCVMSRKPLGFGLPETPFDGLAENASAQERQKAVETWRKALKDKWGQWYFKYRPYAQRDDLQEGLFRGGNK